MLFFSMETPGVQIQANLIRQQIPRQYYWKFDSVPVIVLIFTRLGQYRPILENKYVRE